MVLSRDDLKEKLAEAMGIHDPSDAEIEIAEEEFLHGFSYALRHVEDDEERERLEDLYEEQRNELA
ncbi:hypothetical protein [Halorubrum laminariae]|uniref:Uncharacterized protein n=1 Tax=Halorubrum laminariae TaxID=1433523 RepID=A0ABD6C2D8_9EURY|nr:hypothetical protein [Halorubrum laminariae]